MVTAILYQVTQRQRPIHRVTQVQVICPQKQTPGIIRMADSIKFKTDIKKVTELMLRHTSKRHQTTKLGTIINPRSNKTTANKHICKSTAEGGD